MDAQDWLDMNEEQIISVMYYVYDPKTKQKNNIGLGYAAIIDETNQIAVMLTQFGNKETTHIYGGEVISYIKSHKGEFVIESVAFKTPREALRPSLPPSH